LKKYNDIEPMGRNHVYVDRKKMYDILEKRLLDLFGVDFKKSFGILMNKDTNDTIENSNYTKRLSKSNIVQKIRDDIKNSLIVKEIKPDGTYVWKKIIK
jgi:23S rRNA G2445 N2-methylase RlmL